MGGEPIASAPIAAGALAAAAVALPPVLWTAGDLEPLFAQLAPILEDWDKEYLLATAKDIAPAAVKVVEAYKWNADARGALVQSGAGLAAKWLNKSGISAENKEEVRFGIAALTVYWGHHKLGKELKAIADELKAERERAAKSKETNDRRADN